MAKPKKNKGGVISIDATRASEAVEQCLKRMASKKDREYFRPFLMALVCQNAIPAALLEKIPVSAEEAGKTKFDQLYDAAMSIAFPSYRPETLNRLLGPSFKVSDDTKIWRVILPAKFRIAHVLIRADTYQQAFALACDYACRVAMRMHGHIPPDLTIRVMFVTEKAIKRRLDLRWANRVNKRRQLQLVGRIYTNKEILGARIAALGDPRNPMFSLARYVDMKDLTRVLKAKLKVRVSSVESEIHLKA